MPGFLHHPTNRRSFLRLTVAGTAGFFARGLAAPAAAPGAEPGFRVALLADTHIPGDRQNGHRGFNPWEHLRQIAPEVVRARPETVLIIGDAARLDGKRDDYRELRALLEPIAEIAPVHIGLGNHDDRGPFFEVFPDAPGSGSPVPGRHVTIVEHEVVRIVLLDSLLYVNRVAGLLGKAQRLWLESFLPKADDRPLVLGVHHTLGDGDGELLDVDRLFALIRPHPHVKAIFYGHSHVWEISERQGLKLINLPAVGYNFRDQDPVGWVDARFSRDGVALTLHALAGNRAEDGTTTQVRWG